MQQILTENMRAIADKIAEYTGSINEATPKIDPESASPEDNSLDELLTKPAGINKLLQNINPQQLAQRLHIPPDNIHAFVSGLEKLGSDKPQLDNQQAEAFAIAFSNIVNPISENISLNEQYVSLADVEQALKIAVEFSPESEQNATLLIKSILKAAQGKSLYGEIGDLFSAIVSIVKCGISGDRKNLRSTISNFEERYEGKPGTLSEREFYFISALIEKIGQDLFAQFWENKAKTHMSTTA